MMRATLLIITNFSVMILIGFLLMFTGIYPHNVIKMMVTACVVGFGGAFTSLFLSKWIAIRSIHAKVIERPSNEMEYWLINVVKYQSYKVGIEMPTVAIYPAYDINAFATGAKRNESLVAISSGLLHNMNRNEVEAVLAHEISHIDNGDMVTMTLIQGVLNTFVIFISSAVSLVLSKVISNMLMPNMENHRYNNYRYNQINAKLYSSISAALGTLFGTFASLVTMWFSRRREFYADIGAAKIVGADKMISALERLKSSYEPQEPNNLITLCIHGKKDFFVELFASHPPLEQRINALRRYHNSIKKF
ncbi:protease HtpX [Candidatus Pantoea edessiphila]|uniref:Protease HtpX n=1 Tax=Candidatus Pantoea edessiphila TaxID=2044610 RepID=A0A2P5T0U8_9GAMM|nr:protease HtpX [Candidatus Pantoea edessiphila]PPI88183.1 protease HtpX [Candidatus Pantoea edessiphila]